MTSCNDGIGIEVKGSKRENKGTKGPEGTGLASKVFCAGNGEVDTIFLGWLITT